MGSREIQIQQLFEAMRTAERNKDMDPRGYVKARIAYYRASEGDEWLSNETERLRKEADATTSQWRSKYKTLQALRDSHRPNLDAVRVAETSQLGMQEDVSYAIQELKKLISADTDQALLKEREQYFRVVHHSIPPWVRTALDGIIVLLLFYAMYTAYSILGVRWSATSYLIARERVDALRRQVLPTFLPK